MRSKSLISQISSGHLTVADEKYIAIIFIYIPALPWRILKDIDTGKLLIHRRLVTCGCTHLRPDKKIVCFPAPPIQIVGFFKRFFYFKIFFFFEFILHFDLKKNTMKCRATLALDSLPPPRHLCDTWH